MSKRKTKAELMHDVEYHRSESMVFRARWIESRKEIETLQTKLDKAESYVEQGRSMITAVMDRWYEYDT